MPRRPRLAAGLFALLGLALMPGPGTRGDDAAGPSEQALPSAQRDRLPIPPGLPRYEIDCRIDPHARRVLAHERVEFTNRACIPVTELVFHIYPRYRVPDDGQLKLAKTLEILRLSPEEAMDRQGRRLEVASCRAGGQEAAFRFDPQQDTILIVPLPGPVAPGEAVAAEIDFALDLPEKWGRWGSYDGITYLINWYPVLCHHDDRGWERTPFVPWHQPWYQEAGHYLVRAELPADQVVASTGRIIGEQPAGRGYKRVTIAGRPARDFALVCSDRFRTRERQVGGTRVRVLAFPEHADNAQAALDYASEVIPLYERWFGPYYDDEFEIAASFFGWNGNECSGLVLLDERVLRMPSVGARYLDHLVTHETCHQWWWNVVGSDGYGETFMDEGLVNCFTALRLDAKYGRNAPLIVWPKGLRWLPTIGREDLRLSGYYGWRARGGTGPVIQDLGKMGNLEALFSLAYDRGGKVLNTIHARMGDDRFFGFFRKVYGAYAYRTLHYDDLKAELAAYDPAGGWPTFLDNWLLAHKECDWSVEAVHDEPAAADPEVRRVTVELDQRGQLVEPTILQCRCGERVARVPIWPDRCPYEVPGATVDRAPSGNRLVVTLQAPGRPSQVEVDPDHALLDARPDNNRWKPEVAFRLTPMVTPVDEASWFQPFDRWSLVAGPFIDQYARGGVRAAAQRSDILQLSGWVGAAPSRSLAIFGADAMLLNFPSPMWNVGGYYQEGLYNFNNDRRHNGGRAFVRRRLIANSSFLADDSAFYELYYGFGNSFWPGDDGRPTDKWLAGVGGRMWFNTQFPYWDPVGGHLLEIAAEYGDRAIGSAYQYTRILGQYGFVWSPPEEWGWLSRVRFAWRAYGGFGWPDARTYFRLGAGNRLRALDYQQGWGSSLWLITSEVRFPIWRQIDRDLCDHILAFHNLYGAAFLDVGQPYFHGAWFPVVFGPGLGLRLDVGLFSFLERATLRLDIAQPIYGGGSVPAYHPGRGGPVLWFGLNQVF